MIYINGDYLILSKEFKKSTNKLNVKHETCGNIIQMSSHDFVVGHQCPICQKKKMSIDKTQRKIPKTKRTAQEYISKIKEANPDYSFSDIDELKNGESYIHFTHACGYSGVSKAKYFLNHHKCAKCSYNKDEIFRQKFKNKFNLKYELLEISSKYISVKCLHCNKIIKRSKYGALNVSDFCNCHNEEHFASRIKSLHNGEYEYISGYINQKSIVTLRHIKCGKTFKVRASHFLYDNVSCSKCNCSQNEARIEEYFISNRIDYIHQYAPGCKDKQKLLYDFYIPTKNILIEYDGEQHFLPIYGSDALEDTKKHDNIKTEYALNQNICLIRIPYWEKRKIPQILNKILYTKNIDIEKDNLYLSFDEDMPKKVKRLLCTSK